MELIEGIETRRSIRAFKPEPVPKDLIERILAVAGKSPSYSNTQPWEVVVATGDKKDELRQILCGLVKSDAAPNPDLPSPQSWPPEIEKRSREHNARRFKVVGIERENTEQRLEMRLRNFEFYGAPCVLFLFVDNTLTSWSIFDMGLFAQNIILAAHSLGISSCLQAVVTNYPDAIRECLNVPETKKLVIGISMGYPDLEARLNAYHSTRIEMDDFAQWR